MFIIENQIPLLITFFLTGCAATGFLLRKPAGHRAWRLADLVWVLLGGIGALGAVLAEVYKTDSTRIERQIDIAYAASSAFDRDAARFRLGYCEVPASPQVAQLCDKADFLSASTAANSDLPLFLDITRQVSPLQRLGLSRSDSDMGAMSDKMAVADRFDPAPFVVFAARDADTDQALAQLRVSNPRLAADFTILANSYDTLIAQVGTLKTEWEILQDSAFILLLQIVAICLVGFAAPFRLGKSLVELLKRID